MGQNSAVSGDVPDFVFEFGHECPHCDKKLLVTDVIVLVQICIPALSEHGTVLYQPFLDGQGGYAYEPRFFHEECWQKNDEALHSELEDADCQEVEDPQYSFRTCQACRSGIRLGEPTLVTQTGEVQASKRCPDGKPAYAFEAYLRTTELWCLCCARTWNETILTIWDSISYNNECSGCTYDRVWRHGAVCDHEKEET